MDYVAAGEVADSQTIFDFFFKIHYFNVHYDRSATTCHAVAPNSFAQMCFDAPALLDGLRDMRSGKGIAVQEMALCLGRCVETGSGKNQC